jgi:branched-chain amino acid transport system substrate-binding protein
LRAARDDVDLAPGTLMIAPVERAAAADRVLLDRLAERQVLPTDYVLSTYAAVEIVLQSLETDANDGAPIAAALSGQTFQTALGPVRFDDKGDWIGEHYRLYRYDGTAFQPMD